MLIVELSGRSHCVGWLYTKQSATVQIENKYLCVCFVSVVVVAVFEIIANLCRWNICVRNLRRVWTR